MIGGVNDGRELMMIGGIIEAHDGGMMMIGGVNDGREIADGLVTY